MLDKLLANAKLVIAAAAGAALVAGGGAVAITQVSDSTASTDTPAVTDTGAAHASDQGEESRSDTATASIALPKPTKSSEAGGAQGVHGACVSKVAKDRTNVGRAHGKAVSAAAKSCAKDATTATQTQAGTTQHGKSAQKHGHR